MTGDGYFAKIFLRIRNQDDLDEFSRLIGREVDANVITMTFPSYVTTMRKEQHTSKRLKRITDEEWQKHWCGPPVFTYILLRLSWRSGLSSALVARPGILSPVVSPK